MSPWRLVAGTVALWSCASGCGGDGGADGYSADLRARFVVDCAAHGTPQDQCRCFYDALEANVEFERFERLDDALRVGGREIPDDVADLAAACAGDPATAPTTSTPPPDAPAS
ncbi:MAG TPA: hypothetical protein VIL36_13665 [Acidimicrobiales bacterium]